MSCDRVNREGPIAEEADNIGYPQPKAAIVDATKAWGHTCLAVRIPEEQDIGIILTRKALIF